MLSCSAVIERVVGMGMETVTLNLFNTIQKAQARDLMNNDCGGTVNANTCYNKNTYSSRLEMVNLGII